MFFSFIFLNPLILTVSWRARRCPWKKNLKKLKFNFFSPYCTPRLPISVHKKIQHIWSIRLAGYGEHLYEWLGLSVRFVKLLEIFSTQVRSFCIEHLSFCKFSVEFCLFTYLISSSASTDRGKISNGLYRNFDENIWFNYLLPMADNVREY